MVLACCGLVFVTTLPLSALVIEPDLYDHAKLHPDRAPMLESVGQLGTRQSGSAVYLGKRWILTANHAFAARRGDVVYFAGEEFKLRPATAVRLKNPHASSSDRVTDLLMVQLETAPNLPGLQIDEHSPFVAERVVMIGCGQTELPSAADALLTETPSKGSDDYPELRQISGGLVNGVASPHWGENEVAERGMNVGIPNKPGATRAFVTIKQMDHQVRLTQGAAGDSGGGVFVKRGNKWKLSGIMLSVLNREDMGAGATFSADLSVYREQIEATIPEPSVVGLLFLATLALCGRRSR